MGKQLINKKRKSKYKGNNNYEQALDDIRHGRITEYASVDEMFNKILSD